MGRLLRENAALLLKLASDIALEYLRGRKAKKVVEQVRAEELAKTLKDL